MPRSKPKPAPEAAPAENGRRIPLRITDTTLRDAHQSLWATRMRTADILQIIDVIDNVGYYSLEMWGGATFDVCLRFLREDPWERLRQIKARAKKTPLQMLLRGQNILGYKNYSDDVLDRFIALAVENGIDIFRIFDALNDTRNLEQAIKSVKRYGGHAQGTICYTISPVHTVEEFVRVAKEQIQMGIDSLCIKDMAGILSPIACERLVSALIRQTSIPIQIHSHTTSGMAIATYVEGVRAGAGAIDCAISPMSGFSSQPPVETMLAIFAETSYHANLDMEALREVCRYFAELAPQRQLSHHQAENVIDPEVLLHHIPGGMISNLRSQLQQQNALDKINEVFEELPRVRADLGYPPLVTPTSQIVGIQAVMNVLAGKRYELVSQEIKDYVRGLYGKSPAPINPAVKRKILGSDKPIDCRPADLLPPMLPTVTEGVDPKLIQKEEDILSYCLFPEPTLEFLKWQALPPDQRSPIPADTELKKQEQVQAEKPPTPPKAFLAPTDYQALHLLLAKVQELNLSELTIRRDDLSLILKSEGISSKTAPAPAATPPKDAPAATPAPAIPPATEPLAPAPAEPAPDAAPALTINAPLNGTFYRSPGPGKPRFAGEGDLVKTGDTVCIVEAMKLFNEIKAPCNGKILKILVEHGKAVTKDEPLLSIEKT
jgi:oxaloacetate decarboxylase (Na+ extruding) subunit alpha